MAEFTTVNGGQTLHYQGYIDYARLLRIIREQLEKRGYQYLEKEQNELVKKTGRELYLEIDADKAVSQYAKLRIVLKCTARELKDVEVEIKNKKRQVNDAKITIRAESYLITDYEGRYEGKAWLFFMRTIAEKYFYTREMKKFKHLAAQDLKDLLQETKKYMNFFAR